MMDKLKLETLVNGLLDGTGRFLVEIEISAGNIVDVIIDGDQGITIGECASLSRLIESEFDRDREDYELRVSSPGLDRPFKLRRQFQKYLNRPIRVVLADGQRWKGILSEMNDEGIVVERIIDKKSKKPVNEFIPYDSLKEARPDIVFK
jgi:ribosome maturation factor RimP